jgi:hypothetical protein
VFGIERWSVYAGGIDKDFLHTGTLFQVGFIQGSV